MRGRRSPRLQLAAWPQPLKGALGFQPGPGDILADLQFTGPVMLAGAVLVDSNPSRSLWTRR